MHIGWVGGIERSMAFFEKVAANAGHTLEVHSGHTGGRGSEGLARLVERSDVVIIVVEINSHGAVLQAKELARRRGRPAYMIRKPSISALQRVIAQLPSAAAA